jgi:hypothetical protein
MKMNPIKTIALSLVLGAALNGSSFAGPATWVQRPSPTAPARPLGITFAFSGHLGKQPYTATPETRTRPFNAGEGVVSIPY